MVRIRKAALVALMILAAMVAPIAMPIRMLVLRRRRDGARTEFVVRHERHFELELPETAA